MTQTRDDGGSQPDRHGGSLNRMIQTAVGLWASNVAIQVTLESPPAPVPLPEAPPRLPERLGIFVNRSGELELLTARLGPTADPRGPVAVTGPRGMGVTSLALEAAHRLAGAYPDGQILVDLGQPGRQLPDHLSKLLYELRVPVPPGPVPHQAELYRASAAGRRALFVFLNASDPELLAALLPNAHGCGVIVTARSELPGLQAAGQCRLGPLDQDATMELLTEIVGRERVAAQPAPAWRIAHWCAGDPLTTELVARWMDQPGNQARPLTAIHAQLQRQHLVRLLEQSKQVTAIGVACQGVSPEGRRVLKALALLPFNTFEVGLAAAVARLPDPKIRDAVTELHRAGLLDAAVEGQDRFRVPPPVLAYAFAWTPQSSWRRRTVLRDAALHYIERMRLEGLDPSGVRELLDWTRREYGNIVTTIRHAVQAGLDDLVWRLSVRCAPLFRACGLHAAWERVARWGARAAERLGVREPVAVALTAENLGDVHLDAAARHQAAGDPTAAAGRVREAIDCYERSRRYWQRCDDQAGAAQLHAKLGAAYERAGAYPDAIRADRQFLELFGVDEHPELAVGVLARLAERVAKTEGPASAIAYAEQGRALCQRLDDRHGALSFLVREGTLQQQRGATDLALERLELAEREAVELADHGALATAAWHAGEAQREGGRPAEAAAAYRRAAAAAVAADDPARAIAALRMSASSYQDASRDQDARAALHGLAELQAEAGDDARLKTLWLLGNVCRKLGDLDEAAEHLASCHQLADQQGKGLARAQALNALAAVREQQAELELADSGATLAARRAAATAAAESAELFRAHQRPLDAARALHRCGRLRLRLDEPGPAVQALEAAAAELRDSGGREELAAVLATLGEARLRRNQPGDRLAAAGAFRESGELLLAAGRPDEAVEPLRGAADQLGGPDHARERAEVHKLLADAHSRLGEHRNAAIALRMSATDLAEAGDPDGLRAHRLRVAADAWLKDGDKPVAVTAYREAAVAHRDARQQDHAIASFRAAVEHAGDPATRAGLLHDLGAVCLDARRLEAAVEALDKAVTLFEQEQAGPERITSALLLLGAAHQQIDPAADAAVKAFARAVKIFKEELDTSRASQADARERLAGVLDRRGEPVAAARELEAAGNLYARAVGWEPNARDDSLQAASALGPDTREGVLQAVNALERAGVLYRKGGQLDDSRKTLERAVAHVTAAKVEQARPSVFRELATTCLASAGDRERAGQAAQHATRHTKLVRAGADGPGGAASLREALEFQVRACTAAGWAVAAADAEQEIARLQPPSPAATPTSDWIQALPGRQVPAGSKLTTPAADLARPADQARQADVAEWLRKRVEQLLPSTEPANEPTETIEPTIRPYHRPEGPAPGGTMWER